MIDIMPNYLNKYAYNIQNKSNSISFMIKCECNTTEFQVLKMKSPEKKKKNDLSIEEYIETMRGNFMERYAEAFSDISIYSITDGRKKLIFEEETA